MRKYVAVAMLVMLVLLAGLKFLPAQEVKAGGNCLPSMVAMTMADPQGDIQNGRENVSRADACVDGNEVYVRAWSAWPGPGSRGYEEQKLSYDIEIQDLTEGGKVVFRREGVINNRPGSQGLLAVEFSYPVEDRYHEYHAFVWAKAQQVECGNSGGDASAQAHRDADEAPTPTSTATPSPSPSPSPTGTETPMDAPTPTETPTVTPSPSPMPSPTLTPTPLPPMKEGQSQLAGSYLAIEDKAEKAELEQDPGEKAKLGELFKDGVRDGQPVHEMYQPAYSLGYDPVQNVWRVLSGFDSEKESSLCYELTYTEIMPRVYRLDQVILQSDGGKAVIDTVPYSWSGGQTQKAQICQEGETGVVGRVEAILTGEHVEIMLAGYGGVPFRGASWVINYEWLRKNDAELAALLDFSELASRYLFDLGINTGDSELWQPGNSIERYLAAVAADGGLGLGAPSLHSQMMSYSGVYQNPNVGQLFWAGQEFSAEGQVYDGSWISNPCPLVTGICPDGSQNITRTEVAENLYQVEISFNQPHISEVQIVRDWDGQVMEAEYVDGTASFTDTFDAAPYWTKTSLDYGRAAYWPRYSVLMVDGHPALRFDTPELQQLYADVTMLYTPSPQFVDWFERYGGGLYNPNPNARQEVFARIRELGLSESATLAEIWRAASIKLAAERGLELPAETPIDEIVDSGADQTVVPLDKELLNGLVSDAQAASGANVKAGFGLNDVPPAVGTVMLGWVLFCTIWAIRRRAW